MRDPFPKFKQLLKKTGKIVIVTHWNPDGDAIGSSLALYHYLKKTGKSVEFIVPNSFPEFLNWMPGTGKIVNFETQENKALKLLAKAELIFTLDFNAFKRLEKLGEVLASTPAKKVLIDHHRQPENYADYFFHDIHASSTCELVYELIVGLKGKDLIDKKIAACLYTGLMTDTGSFKFSSVNTKTHQILAELLKTGIQPQAIHSAVYDNYSAHRLRLFGYALSEKLRLVKDYPVAYFCLKAEELKRFEFQKGDTEGLVNYPFMIKGIEVCALFSESEGMIKISFRSKGKVDVNTFARTYFNGGGHLNAAGGKSKESLEATEQKFLDTLNTLF
ncbi:MAG: bifunctional oligoribonuclease/PAP phosphatase NrnA [Bacteroidia bacterium]|nr:bifunctional oligoribonuclease/PAP phosphatase NrnA [Bacteroidia bacterium]